jgi:enoyl-CoA hydratase
MAEAPRAEVAEHEDAEAPAVLVERHERMLVITLNRPEARNAINLAVAEGLADALETLDADKELSVGVLTGAGKGFCAGMDLKAFARGERPWVQGRGFAGIVQGSAVKPLVAAVEGFAVAGGLEIALACDLIVAAEGAKLGIPEVKRSLVAAGGALLRLPRRMPYHVAMELALTGEPIVAERAAALGLINRVVPAGTTLEAAIALAHEVASGAPLALIASKRILQEQWDWPSADAFRLQAEITEPVFNSEDAREGAAAFAEKRAPVWRGR